MLREALPQAPHEPGAGSVGRMSEPDPHRPPGHRRRTVHDFDSSYSGQPPWDIGRPQPAFVEIGDVGKLEGCVLDVGCGTGEHALMAAERGRPALGVDTPRRRSRSPSGTHGSGGLPRGSWCGTPGRPREPGRAVRHGAGQRAVPGVRRRRPGPVRRQPAGCDRALPHAVLQRSAAGRLRAPPGHARRDRAELHGWRIAAIEPVVFETNLDPGDVPAWRTETHRGRPAG